MAARDAAAAKYLVPLSIHLKQTDLGTCLLACAWRWRGLSLLPWRYRFAFWLPPPFLPLVEEDARPRFFVRPFSQQVARGHSTLMVRRSCSRRSFQLEADAAVIEA